MLSSRYFFSEHAFRQRIKGPVEYVLGAVQAVLQREGGFDPRRQLDFLSRHGVANVFATPTAIRQSSPTMNS